MFKVKRRYYVKVYRAGTYYRAEKGYDKKEDAKAAEGILKAKLKVTQPKGPAPKVFGELWGLYLEFCEQHNSPHWVEQKICVGKKYLLPKWFDRFLESITIEELQEHFKERKKLSIRSANLDFEILKNFYNWCYDMDYISLNPFSKKSILKPYPYTLKERTLPSQEEVDKLIESNEGTEKLLLLMLTGTAARIGELQNLQWSDVDLEQKIIRLRTHKTADGSEKVREIPINGELFLALSEIPVEKRTGYVLKHHGAGKQYHDMNPMLKRIYKKAAIVRNGGFHTFRHFVISKLMEKGINPVSVRDLAGHSSLKVTSRYSHSNAQGLKEAVELL